MKFILDVECSNEYSDGGPKFLVVELADHDIERIRKIQEILQSVKAEDPRGTTLFSEVSVDWLDGEWLEELPEDYRECVWLMDDEPEEDAETSSKCCYGIRGSGTFISSKSIHFEAYHKNSGDNYSAYSIDVKALLAAMEMSVDDAPKHINSDDHYMKARAKELLKG